MSAENVKKIIGRAVTDPAFRELLFNKPDEALAGYDLTDEEIASLKSLPREQFDSTTIQLEERVSRAGIHLGDMVGSVLGAAGAGGESVSGEGGVGDAGAPGGAGEPGDAGEAVGATAPGGAEGEVAIPALDGSSSEAPAEIGALDHDSVGPDMKFVEPEGLDAHEGRVDFVKADEFDEGLDYKFFEPAPDAHEAPGEVAPPEELDAGLDFKFIEPEDVEVQGDSVDYVKVDELDEGLDFKFIEPEDVEVREAPVDAVPPDEFDAGVAFDDQPSGDLGNDMSSLDEKGNDMIFLDGKGGDIAPDM